MFNLFLQALNQRIIWIFNLFRGKASDDSNGDSYKRLAEKLMDKYGELDSAGNYNRVLGWEKIGVDAIKSDLQHNQGLTHVGKNTALAWLWVRREEERAQTREREAQEKERKQQESFFAVFKRAFKELCAHITLILILMLLAFVLGGLFGKDVGDSLSKFIEHL